MSVFYDHTADNFAQAQPEDKDPLQRLGRMLRGLFYIYSGQNKPALPF
jgi:hypothetical protein